MRAKRASAWITAAVMAGVCILPAYAEGNDSEGLFRATVGLASKNLDVQSWLPDFEVHEGQNKVTITPPKNSKGGSTSIKDLGLLVIDLKDCFYEVGAVSVDEILVDGEPLSFNNDAVIYGADDGTDNDDFRIELYSTYGKTKEEPPFDVSSVTVSDSIELTFTVSRDGYSGTKKTLCGNVVANKNSDTPVALTDFSVEITSDEDTLTPGEDISVTVEDDKFYAELKRGIYDMTVSKDGYVTREYKGIRMGKKDPYELADIDLRELGDINGDGDINVTDISLTAAYVKQIRAFSEDYQLNVADVNRDGDLNVTDITVIAAHVKGIREIS